MSPARRTWMVMLFLDLFLLALLAWSATVVEPGTSTYAITQLSAIILIAGAILMGLILYSGWNPQ